MNGVLEVQIEYYRVFFIVCNKCSNASLNLFLAKTDFGVLTFLNFFLSEDYRQ